MYPGEGEVLHFSEDPDIVEFVPHVAPTSLESEPYVWAVDTARAPDYWFPRQCPRVMAWVDARTTPADRALLGTAERVHVIEYGWLDRLRTVELYAYRLPADSFRSIGEHAHALVSSVPVRPLGPPERVDDVLALHERAGIELRLAANVWPACDAWMDTTLGCSAIRLGNARPRPSG